MHHQHLYLMCYRNGNQSATTYFFGTCTILNPKLSNRAPYNNSYFFPSCPWETFLETVSAITTSPETTITFHNRWEEIFIEPGYTTLKPCIFSGIPRLESFRDLSRVTGSNIRGRINTVQLMKVIEYDIREIKRDDVSELTNHDETSKNISGKGHMKKTRHPPPS